MIPAHALARDALATVLRRAPMSPEKVELAWKMSVGPAVAQATAGVALEDSVLRVRARDAAWRNEIEHSAGLVRRRINALLGEPAIREIRVTID